MLFKSLYGNCSFWFKGNRYKVEEYFDTEDPELIEFLLQNTNFERLEPEEDKKKLKKGGGNG